MDRAFMQGGIAASSIGLIAGALVYTGANEILSLYGAKHRKRSSLADETQDTQEDNSMAIALGALLDGIPESIVIGLSLLDGAGVSTVAVIATYRPKKCVLGI